MKDLIEKKGKLCYRSMDLQTLKFDQYNKEKVDRIMNEQNKIYKKYIFYKEYIKSINKEKRK